MSGAFETYLARETSLTKEELTFMLSLATAKKVRRRHLLLHEGEVCRHKIFVIKGLLRTYRTKDDGTEYIMRFSAENSWNMDLESYHNQIPSKFNIDALEDSEVLIWTRDDLENLLITIPAFKAYSDMLKATSLNASQNRVLMNISYTAEEKYQEFITTFPEIFRRVPLHMVASYLGVSRETLTRIRRTMA